MKRNVYLFIALSLFTYTTVIGCDECSDTALADVNEKTLPISREGEYTPLICSSRLSGFCGELLRTPSLPMFAPSV